MFQIKKNPTLLLMGISYGVLRHFQQYFSYIVNVSFIGGGNRRPAAGR
jgi:hypothetical protein